MERIHRQEEKVFKAIIVIASINSMTAMQLEDKKGPYLTSKECYYRGAEMIREAANRLPLAFASSICLVIPKKDESENKVEEKDV